MDEANTVVTYATTQVNAMVSPMGEVRRPKEIIILLLYLGGFGNGLGAFLESMFFPAVAVEMNLGFGVLCLGLAGLITHGSGR